MQRLGFRRWRDTASAVSLRWLVAGLISAGPLIPVATATDGGGSVYPVGAETVLPGLVPAPGASALGNFDLFYQANGVADNEGHNAVSGFHFRLGGVAFKFTHNWGIHVLGGTLVSYIAQPILYEHLDGGLGAERGPASAIRSSSRPRSPTSMAAGTGGTGWIFIRPVGATRN